MPAGMDYPIDVTEGKSWRKFDPRDQMAFNQEFFSPEAIETRLARKLALKGAADVEREKNLLPLKQKLFQSTELAKTAMEGMYAKDVQNLRNVPSMSALEWDKSPKKFQQGLAEIGARNTPAMESLAWEKSPSKMSQDIMKLNLMRAPEFQRNALDREKFDFEKSLLKRKPLDEAMQDVSGKGATMASQPSVPPGMAGNPAVDESRSPASWREDPDLAEAFGSGMESHYKPLEKTKSWMTPSQKKAFKESILLNWPTM